MNSFANLLAIVIIAVWMLAIAFISVQNAQPVSLEFFGQRSIAIPFGLLLTITTTIGMLGFTLLQPVFSSSERTQLRDKDY